MSESVIVTEAVIVNLLQQYPRGMPARAVADRLQVRRKLAESRLSKLAAYGVIKSRREGPRAIYSVKMAARSEQRK